MRKATSLFFIVVVGALFASCGTTQLTTLWQDQTYSAAPLKKVMVIAFRKSPVNRRMWEDAVVSAFAAQKVTTAVVPSYQLFPDEAPSPDDVQQKARDQEFDGVLIVAKVEIDTVTNEVPGYTTSEPFSVYSRKWNTYVTRYKDVYHDGYTDSSLTVKVRTDLLLTQNADGQLVWSATSEKVSPSSRDDFRSSVAGSVAKQLSKSRFMR